jgi:two-component system phosphate regulon response regulator PhoB
MARPSVLIIGKRGKLRHRLESSLQMAGCRVMTASDSTQALQCVAEASPDIVMTGQDLPGTDALDVCRQIRHALHPKRPPVFLLTPQGEIEDTLDGRLPGIEWERRGWNFVEYGFGALLAWLEASGGVRERISCEGLELDRRSFQATVDGQDIKLTATEFRLLWALADQPGKVFDRQQLARACSSEGRSQMRTIDVHIKAIRDKLGDRSSLIQTVHGVGYRFRDCATSNRLEPAAVPAGR